MRYILDQEDWLAFWSLYHFINDLSEKYPEIDLSDIYEDRALLSKYFAFA